MGFSRPGRSKVFATNERSWGPNLSCSSSVGCGLDNTGRNAVESIGMSTIWLSGRHIATFQALTVEHLSHAD